MQMVYNYRNAIKSDILDYLKENEGRLKQDGFFNQSREDQEQELADIARLEDNITGNASGSYTFNAYEAHENLLGNEGLIEDCVNEFGIDMAKHRNDPEYLDVSLRCYLLYECISDALDEREEEQGNENDTDE